MEHEIYYNISKKSFGRSVRLFVRLFVCLSVTFFSISVRSLLICPTVFPSRFLPHKRNDLTGYLKAKINNLYAFREEKDH